MDAQSGVKIAFNLKMIPVDENGIPELGIPFIAMFNPESFSIKDEIVWCKEPVVGKEGGKPNYKHTKPRVFTLEFVLDGTGVNTNGIKIPVTAQVALFRAATTSLKGLVHRPPYLMVQYGTFINTCVLNSSNITYTMFDMFGLPIRAKISATFTEKKTGLSEILGMFSSPDLTHQITVTDGDLLPLLTHKIYKNQHYYLQVAKVNKLKNFRKLRPGSTLKFPPVSK